MVAVVLADDRLLTWRASTDDAKAVLWDAAGGRVVAALQHLSKIDGAVPVAPQNILTWPRAHRGLYAMMPGLHDLSGIGAAHAAYRLWSASSGCSLTSIDRAEALRLFPGLDAVEYQEVEEAAGPGITTGVVTRDVAAETATAQRRETGPRHGLVLRTDGRSVALTALANGARLSEWHSSAHICPGPMFPGGTVAIYEEGGAVRFLGLYRGLQRIDWSGELLAEAVLT